MSFIRDLQCKNVLHVCLAGSMAVGLVAGCAASDPIRPTVLPTNYLNPYQSISFVFKSEPGEAFNTFTAIPCGDPITWKDVQVIWIDPEVNLEEELTERVGDYILQNDEWAGYLFSGTRTQYIVKAQRVFASMGCNLFVIQGVNEIPRMVRWAGFSKVEDVIPVRWGSDAESIN